MSAFSLATHVIGSIVIIYTIHSTYAYIGAEKNKMYSPPAPPNKYSATASGSMPSAN